jgi:Zn-dependent protease with chaperone function
VLTVGYRSTTSTLVLPQELIETLDDRELEAVVAHELAYIANRDAAVSAPSSVARLARSRYGYNPVVGPLSMLVRTLSRWHVALVSYGREYAADDGAVAITGDPATARVSRALTAGCVHTWLAGAIFSASNLVLFPDTWLLSIDFAFCSPPVRPLSKYD